MESRKCPKCGVVLNGSKLWIEKMLTKPCKDHKGSGTTLWQ